MKNTKTLKDIHLLFVDDELDIVESTVELLKYHINKIDIAHNGEEALAMYHKVKPDIIITDIFMPVMSGLDFAKELRKIDKDIPIIVNSSFTDIKFFQDSIKVGISDYIIKPSTMETLVDTIERNRTSIETNKKYKFEQNLMQTIIDEVDDLIILLNLDGTTRTINKSASNFSKKDTVSQILSETHKYESTTSNQTFFEYLFESKEAYKYTYTYSDKSDAKYFYKVQFKPVFNHGQPQSILVTAHDITEHKIIENTLTERKDALKHLANHDGLTDIPNRNRFLQIINKYINEAKNKNNQFAIFYIDLDKFKDVNDTFGHDTGDMLLRNVSKRIIEVLRTDDVVARLGGDEFSIIIKNMGDIETISKIAKKINDTISKDFTINNNIIKTHCSIGISIYPDNGNTTEILLRHADEAMYAAKYYGKNQFMFYTKELNEKNRQKTKLESDLEYAINNNQFEVYYQPQIDTKNRKIIGIEALLRWNHPTKGLLSPHYFIEIANNIGLLYLIDKFVISESIKTLTELKNSISFSGTVVLNLSANTLYADGFLAYIEDVLKKLNCQTNCIELEITENTLVSNKSSAMDILTKLDDIGINTTIDNFGIGQCSLSYLKELPINKIKIDKSFIGDTGNENSKNAIKSIISLANSMNLNIIAEGIENSTQEKFLIQNGCYNVQGYLYSKPLNKINIQTFIELFI